MLPTAYGTKTLLDTGTSAIWPRATILDLVCDETATDSKPLFITEHPTYTYNGTVELAYDY